MKSLIEITLLCESVIEFGEESVNMELHDQWAGLAHLYWR
jgi:hypothetical protein